MPHGVQVRHVRSLAEAQKVLTNLQDIVVAGELRPFVISRVKRKELLQSLAQIKHGLFGFDNTLHTASQWAEIRRILGPEAKQLWQARMDEKPINGQAVTQSNKLKGRILCMSPERQDYRDQAALQTMWTAKLIFAMKEAGVTREQLRSIAGHLPMRPGVREVFRKLAKTSIISWGLRDIIDAWLQANGIWQDFQHSSVRVLEIGAAHLEYDGQGRVADVDSSSVVVNANKGRLASQFLDSYSLSEGVTLAVGDSIYDVDMMPFIRIYRDSSISGVNVLILPPKVALENLNEFEKYQLERLWQHVTCLLIADDFYPLLSLIQEADQAFSPNGDSKAPIQTQKVKEIFGL